MINPQVAYLNKKKEKRNRINTQFEARFGTQGAVALLPRNNIPSAPSAH